MSNSLYLNARGDQWYSRCYYLDVKVVNGIKASLTRIFNFDCLTTIIFLIIIIFPALFNIYNFGVQQKLRLFYDNSRQMLINFLFMISFGVAFSSSIHLILNQPMPCVTWDGINVQPTLNAVRSPDEEIVIVVILCSLLISLKFNSRLSFCIIALTITVLECFGSVFCGLSSISTVIFSILLGVWIVCVFLSLPIGGIPILGIFIFILNFVLFIITLVKYSLHNELFNDSLHLCFRSTLTVLISCFLLIVFGKARPGFDWKQLNSKSNIGSDDAVISIPSMVNDEEQDSFGILLNTDLMFSIIAFILYLISNIILTYIDENFHFMID